MAASVAWISIAPVKGMRMQDLTEVKLGPDGAAGDREFFLVNEKNVLLSVSRIGPLVEIVPEFEPVARFGTLSLNFPDGSVVSSAVEVGEPEAVNFYGEDVRARPVAGAFSEAISEHCDLSLRLMRKPEGRPAVDRGAISGATLLSLASLERLEAAAIERPPGSIDQRRFRMTFGVDGVEPHEEDDWIDGIVSVGEAGVKVQERVGRCAATTRDPDRGNVDLKTLHHIRSYRKDVISEEPLPFGVYASVERPGTVRLGDPVVPSGHPN